MPVFEATVLDIDGTLTPCDTLAITTEALGLPPWELAELDRASRTGALPAHVISETIVRRWSASGRATRQYMRALFESLPLRPDAQDLIAAIRASEVLPCLITSSMDLYAEVMAARLGVHDWYANVHLHFNEAGGLVDLTFSADAAALKRRQLLEFCTANAIVPSAVMVIGDEENDQDLFLETGHGVFIRNRTSNPLEAHAWRTVHTLTEASLLLHPGGTQP